MHLTNLLMKVIDKHAPLRSKRVKHAKNTPWLSHETRKAMDKRDIFDSKDDSESFRQQRNLVNAMVEKDKKTCFDKLLTDEKDTATIWRAMNSITNSNNKKHNSKSIEIEPDTINDFFLNLPNSILTPDIRNASENYECPTQLKAHSSKATANLKYLI